MEADPTGHSAAHFPRPFEGIYGVSLLTAILALVPYIIVTSAYTLFRKQVSHDIGAGATELEIINGLSTAGYAFGALLGGDLINRFKQRYLFLICEGLFIVSCALAAAASGDVVYGAGRVLQGLMTGLLLVIALPDRLAASRADAAGELTIWTAIWWSVRFGREKGLI